MFLQHSTLSWLYISVSVCLSVCLSVYIVVFLSIVCLKLSLPDSLCVHPSDCLSEFVHGTQCKKLVTNSSNHWILCLFSVLFSFCLSVCVPHRDGRPLTDDEIAGLLIGFLLAGQHTSSTTSAWLGFFLARHKTLQDSLYQEQIKVCGEDLPPLEFDQVSSHLLPGSI